MISATRIHYAKGRAILELAFNDGSTGELSAEFLRVHSPSAEVRGHGPGEEVLQTGKAQVNILAIKPVGHYAVQLVFDDGHDSGLYGWEYLHQLCSQRDTLWARYLEQLAAAGASRDPDIQVIQFSP